jgi:hypothetical protein
MVGCTMQMGRNWPAYFGLAQPLGLVAHLSGDRGGAQPTAALAAARPALACRQRC